MGSVVGAILGNILPFNYKGIAFFLNSIIKVGEKNTMAIITDIPLTAATLAKVGCIVRPIFALFSLLSLSLGVENFRKKRVLTNKSSKNVEIVK